MTSWTWSRATSPREVPTTPLESVTLEDALLTPTTKGPLRVLTAPRVWCQGAVYTRDGALVAASQRVNGGYGDVVGSADPESVQVPDPSSGVGRLDGTWIYGGHWMPAFGHFITETLTTPREDVRADGLLFHSFLSPRGSVVPWQQKLLDLAGLAGVPVRIVGRERLVVERLVVTERPYVVNAWAREEAVQVWRRVAERAPVDPDPGPVFLSRSQHNAITREAGKPTRTSAERDEELDRGFAAAGYAVVHPETLSVEEQIAAVARAPVVAGCSGSALHLSAMTLGHAHVLEIGDGRTLTAGLPNQRVIDAARGHCHLFVPHDAPIGPVLDGLESGCRHDPAG